MLLLAGIGLFWGLNWPAMKLAMAEIEPWTFRALGLAVGGVWLLMLGRAWGGRLAVPRADLVPLVWVSLLNVSGWQICSALGLSLMPAGRASIIAFTMPLWAVLLGIVLLGERLTAARAAGLALGLAGMAALLGPDLDRVAAAPAGVLLMLTAAVSWAAGTVALKRVRWHMRAMQLAGWQLLIGSLPAAAGALAFGEPASLAGAGWVSWSALAYTCALAMVWCHWAWFRVVELFPAGVAAIGTLLVPVVGVLSSALILDEPIGTPEITALALVLASLTLVLIVPARPHVARHG
ncbi:MAG TPA: DMT family transporter [Arenibaculum sp.]|nr:DMT family transporter [Arenibaculum sp.]